MKRSLALILACVLVFPFAARSQNEGIKPVANPQTSAQSTMHTKTTQQMSLVQEQGTTGGSTSPSGLSSSKGGMYLEPGWATGRVMLKDQSVLEYLQLRYDIYNQQIQFVRENDTLAFSKPEEVMYFILDDRNFIYAVFQQEGGGLGSGYFEILTDGDCKLLLRRTIKYHADPESKPGLTEEVFVRESEYFIIKDEGVAKPVRNCRKSVLCAFKDKEEQVDDFLEVNDIKMKTCDDLKKVVEYYNSLQ